jgi:hypothetical protein
MDAASNQSLESEFDTTKQEDVIKIILQKGDVQDTQVSFLSCCGINCIERLTDDHDRTASARVTVMSRKALWARTRCSIELR